jgi:hypothetical protein
MRAFLEEDLSLLEGKENAFRRLNREWKYRLEAAGVGIGGQDGAALGCGHWYAVVEHRS